MAKPTETTKWVITHVLDKAGVSYTYQRETNSIAFLLEPPHTYTELLRPMLQYLGNRVGVVRYAIEKGETDKTRIFLYVIVIRIPDNPLFTELIKTHLPGMKPTEKAVRLTRVVLDQSREEFLMEEMFQLTIDDQDGEIDYLDQVQDSLFDVVIWSAIHTVYDSDAATFLDVAWKWAKGWNDPDLEDAADFVLCGLLWTARDHAR